MVKKTRFKRIVIKVGTSTITSKDNRLDKKRMLNIAAQIAKIINGGTEVIIVSSGAIGAGMGMLNICARPQSLPQLQACAAIGQSTLMRMYEEAFKKRRLVAAQILLTQDDLTDRKRYLNAKNTVFTLLDKKVIPVINENDTVSTEEIKFGDNDRLSSLVANMVHADLLVILSDVDGLYEYDEKRKKRIRCIGIVERITRDVEDYAIRQKSKVGTGGMRSKLQAAKIATSSGIPCIIANGSKENILIKIAEGGTVGTLFLAKSQGISARKHWIAYTSRPQGTIKVDSGAKAALIDGQKSLLSSGITSEEGRFAIGDVVGIVDESNNEFARGLTNYSALELKKIRGLKTNEIQGVLGYKHYDEVVHRDNLVIL
ncbi:MAG: glutamate 5-kinase [Candidatus Omnitrophica bacterium]|nr:glutamate 5-kinase [Candidatus Omnitrophota bacterium]